MSIYPYFCLPMAASVTTVGNELAIAPTSNALNDEYALVWRTSSLTNTFVVLDLGSAQSVDTVALIFNNLRSTDTVRVRSGTTAANTTAAPISDTTFNAFTGSKNPDARTQTICDLPATYSARYWRIDITATGHPDGFVQVARILIGMSVYMAEGMDIDASRIMKENSVSYEGPAYQDVDEYMNYSGWSCTMSLIDGTLWRDTVFPFLLKVGVNRRCVLFVPQPLVPTTWQNEVVYGRMTKLIEGQQRVHNAWWCDISIMGIGI